MISLNEEKAKIFLAQNNFTNCTIKKVAGDASFRSYYRIFCEQQTFILMFAPPSHEDIQPFIKIDKFLVEHNFSAPKIFAIDEVEGFILLEDFGDDSYSRVLKAEQSSELVLYQNAANCLLNLHKVAPPQNLEVYNHALLFREVMLFVDWYLPHVKKITMTLQEKSRFKHLWFELFDLLSKENQVLVLRDYHADNLMLLPNCVGYKTVGLLDFQDAVIGSAAYDLVSLLEDARRDVDAQNSQQVFDYYCQKAQGKINDDLDAKSQNLEEVEKNLQNQGKIEQNLGKISQNKANFDKNAFTRDYAILSLQRNIKILGIFARLANRDSKPDYLKLLPRVNKYVIMRLSSTDSVFAEMSNFLQKFI